MKRSALTASVVPLLGALSLLFVGTTVTLSAIPHRASAFGQTSPNEAASSAPSFEPVDWCYLPLLDTGRRGIVATPTRPDGSATDSPTETRLPDDTPSATRSATQTATPSATGDPTLWPSPSPTPTQGVHDPADDRLVPGGSLAAGDTSVSYDEARRLYRLEYLGVPKVAYEIELTHPDVSRGRLTIRETVSGRFPVSGAGLYYRTLEGDLVEPRLMGRLGSVDSVEHALLQDGVSLTVRETIEERDHSKRYTITLHGRALEVHVESLDAAGPAAGTYAGFTSGDVEGTNDGVDVRVPYMESVPVTMLDHWWYASTLLEVPRSRASDHVPRGPQSQPGAFTNEVAALYLPDSAGNVEPVDETVWATVSSLIEDTFPVALNNPSPHRSDLGLKVHLTLPSSTDDVGFAAEADLLDRLTDLGLSDLYVHKLHWAEPTTLLPGQGPPAASAGGSAGLALLAAAARGSLAPTQAYSVTVEGCPGEDAPLYRPDDRVTDPNGQAKGLLPDAGGVRDCGGGDTAGTFLLAPDAAYRVALNEGQADSVPGSGALHLTDVTAWSPAHAWPAAMDNPVDRSSPARHPDNLGAAVLSYKELFGALQERVGPVFGDGAHGSWQAAYDSFYAGYVDGVSRSLSTGSTDQSAGNAYLVVPDYEVQVVRPRMANYGMGSYEQFFGLARSAPAKPLSPEQLDEWRATTISYGHAGSITTTASDPDWLSEAEIVKDYHIMSGLQSRYLDAPLPRVGYVDDEGTEGDLSWALNNEMDLIGPRLHLDYGGELDLWVNHSRDRWSVADPATPGRIIDLPTHGWLAHSDDGRLRGYSALVDERLVDYLWVDGRFELADGRGELVRLGNVVTTDLTIEFADGRRMEEQPDGTMLWVP